MDVYGYILLFAVSCLEVIISYIIGVWVGNNFPIKRS